MDIARVRTDGDNTEFAVRTGDTAWIRVAELGFSPTSTGELIELTPVIDSRLQSGMGTPIRTPQFACPILRPSKVLAIGLNYLDHIRETGNARPIKPVVFAKYVNSLNGPYDSVLIDSDHSREGDYECELAVVIGRRCKFVPTAEALTMVFGYAVANDVSTRDLQRSDGQFSRSKSFDTFCPVGPWITGADSVADPQALPIQSYVNDEIRQDSNTAEMIFGVAHLVSYLSRTMTLEPGDLILTGTPHGVGLGQKPPVFLADGDRVRCEVKGLGAIENVVRVGSGVAEFSAQ